MSVVFFFFFFQAEDGIRDGTVTGVQTCALPIFAMPSDHRLASQDTVALQDIAGEIFIGMSNTAPTLQVVIDDYLKRSGMDLRPLHRVDNLAMAMSLIASTKGVA